MANNLLEEHGDCPNHRVLTRWQRPSSTFGFHCFRWTYGFETPSPWCSRKFSTTRSGRLPPPQPKQRIILLGAFAAPQKTPMGSPPEDLMRFNNGTEGERPNPYICQQFNTRTPTTPESIDYLETLGSDALATMPSRTSSVGQEALVPPSRTTSPRSDARAVVHHHHLA